ncbi:MAG: hypothetical protein LBT97_02885, partial [Planctomycetota bacterium]|nr:hypothetical protein [Planctomycetota bacterium]
MCDNTPTNYTETPFKHGVSGPEDHDPVEANDFADILFESDGARSTGRWCATTDTSSRDGDRFLHPTPITNNPDYKTPDPVRMDAFRGVELQLYGAGDMAPESVAAINAPMRTILDQLKTLDGHSAAATPKYRLMKLEHG